MGPGLFIKSRTYIKSLLLGGSLFIMIRHKMAGGDKKGKGRQPSDVIGERN